MKYLLFLIPLFISCLISTNDDTKVYLEPDQIKGVWYHVQEISSSIPGLYEKDTTAYRIGMDSLPDTGPQYIKDPLTFYIHYSEGGAEYGYIYDPCEEYEWDAEVSTLSYTLVQGLPGPTHEHTITFMMPVAGSLWVEIDSDSFGLSKTF